MKVNEVHPRFKRHHFFFSTSSSSFYFISVISSISSYFFFIFVFFLLPLFTNSVLHTPFTVVKGLACPAACLQLRVHCNHRLSLLIRRRPGSSAITAAAARQYTGAGGVTGISLSLNNHVTIHFCRKTLTAF